MSTLNLQLGAGSKEVLNQTLDILDIGAGGTVICMCLPYSYFSLQQLAVN